MTRFPLLLSLLAAISQATQQTPAEMTTRSSSATFRTAIHEIEVPVVVRDGKGQPVGGLRVEDFRLFDKGKPQTITRFTALTKDASAGSSSAPARYIVYLMNDIYYAPPPLSFRKAALHHIQTSLGPGDRAAIMTTTGRYLIDFTDDAAKLADAMSQIKLDKVLPVVQTDEGRSANATLQGKFHLDSLLAAVRRLAVMPGQRSIVLASIGFLTHDHVEYPRGNLPPRIYRVELAHYAQDVLDQAIRAHVTIGCIDPFGLETVDRIAGAEMRNVLFTMSGATGGIYFHDNNDFDEGLRRASAVPEYSYLLAFSPQNLKYDGSLHELKVTLPGRHDDVQARGSYLAPSKLDDPVEAAREELREGLYSRDDIDELSADMHPGFTRLGPDKVRISVQIHVGVEQLHFKKADGRNAADLTVVVGLFDRNGVYVGGKTTDVELHLKEENLEQWMRSGIKLGCNLDAAPGSYLVRLVVRDSEGRAMAAHNGTVNIQ